MLGRSMNSANSSSMVSESVSSSSMNSKLCDSSIERMQLIYRRLFFFLLDFGRNKVVKAMSRRPFRPQCHQGLSYRSVRPNRWGPVPVYRTGLAGNRSNSNSNSKSHVQPVPTGLPVGLTGLPAGQFD